jgi:biotin operon repressor
MRLFDSCEPFDQTLLEMEWVPPSLTDSIETAVKSSPISSPISSPKTEDKILQQLRENPQCSTQQLGDALGISKRAVLKQIEKLKQQGRLKRVAKRGEDLKLTLQNWRTPESYTKTQTKPPPRFVKLLAWGDGNFSPTSQKNEMNRTKLKTSPAFCALVE